MGRIGRGFNLALFKRTLTEILQRDRIELREHGGLRLLPQWADDRAADFGGENLRILFHFGSADDANDIARRYPAPLARKAIAAARAANALQNSAMHKLLHDLFKVAQRNALTLRHFLGLHRIGAGIKRDIDDSFQRIEHFPRQMQHPYPALSVTPVEPKPPSPRAVSSSAETSCQAACSTGAITIWAMRSPRATRKLSAPRLRRMMPTSPR